MEVGDENTWFTECLLIDEEVRRTWELPEDWMLIAEMPFGVPTGEPGDKDFGDVDKRMKVFR